MQETKNTFCSGLMFRLRIWSAFIEIEEDDLRIWWREYSGRYLVASLAAPASIASHWPLIPLPLAIHNLPSVFPTDAASQEQSPINPAPDSIVKLIGRSNPYANFSKKLSIYWHILWLRLCSRVQSTRIGFTKTYNFYNSLNSTNWSEEKGKILSYQTQTLNRTTLT